MFLFYVKWFKVITSGSNASVRRDKSGLIQVDSTKLWKDARDTFVRSEHCEQVVFKSDPKDPRWLYVVQVAPRNKPICEGLENQDDEEDRLDQVNEVGQLEQADEAGQQEQADEEEEAVQDEEEQAVQDEEEQEEFEDDIDHAEELPNEEDTGHADAKFNDDDAEMHLEIDVFGATDLEEDDRIDDL